MPDNRLKLLLVGDSGVGKTSIILRFTEYYFQEDFVNTIGVDFRCHILEFQKKLYQLQIWDTAGQDKFQSITTAYYRGSHGIIFVYDVCQRDSFDRLRFWYNEVKRRVIDEMPIMIVGNKIDLVSKRTVSYAEGETLAKEWGVPYLECSSKSNEGVDKVFFGLLEKIVEPRGDEQDFEPFDKIEIKSDKKPLYRRCCS